MIHGPGATANLKSACMEEGACKDQFPKECQDETTNDNGFPLYCRRPGPTDRVRGFEMNNRFVVPYNKYLLLRYNCHIIVEVCSSIKSAKYIYKYIYKVYDSSNMELRDGQQLSHHNEIVNFINARYVSAC